MQNDEKLAQVNQDLSMKLSEKDEEICHLWNHNQSLVAQSRS